MKKKALNLDRKLVLRKGQITALTTTQEGNIIGGSFPNLCQTGVKSACPECTVQATEDCTNTQQDASLCQGLGCTVNSCISG